MRHTVHQGSLSATLDLHLAVDEEVSAFPDSLVAMSEEIAMSISSRPSMAANWWGSSGAASTGPAFQPAVFRAEGNPGLLSLAPRFPGSIANILIEPGATLYLIGPAFLAARDGIELSSRLPANQLGNFRRVLPLMTISGEGELFYAGAGDLVHRELQEDEALVVATRCLVGFEDSVDIEWDRPPLERSQSSSVGFSTLRLIGPGQVIYQTRSLNR